MKFKYLILDSIEGTVTGTNNPTVACMAANEEVVINVETGNYITASGNNMTPIPEDTTYIDAASTQG